MACQQVRLPAPGPPPPPGQEPEEEWDGICNPDAVEAEWAALADATKEAAAQEEVRRSCHHADSLVWSP